MHVETVKCYAASVKHCNVTPEVLTFPNRVQIFCFGIFAPNMPVTGKLFLKKKAGNRSNEARSCFGSSDLF